MNQQLREWGPARHRPENAGQRESFRPALDLRDSDGPRPDDN